MRSRAHSAWALPYAAGHGHSMRPSSHTSSNRIRHVRWRCPGVSTPTKGKHEAYTADMFSSGETPRPAESCAPLAARASRERA
jgi:hypothetical protein